MDSVISVKNVTKTYGASRGVTSISFEVPKATVFGFLGPNGAGKSTTINMLIDFIRPTTGHIKVFGLDSVTHSLEIRRRIGFLAGDFALDRGLTGWQQLEYFGSLRGHVDKKYVTQLADRLECKLGKRFRTLSRGNKQKVGLIAALMHKPELLIFDEPTSGLDPLIQAEFNKIILEQKEQGVTTLISSHVLSEVQQLCDYVTFIREGKIIADKPLAEITKGAPRDVRVSGAKDSLAKKLDKQPGIHGLVHKGPLLSFTYSGDINQLLKLISSDEVSDVVIQEPELETIFMGYYEGRDHA